MFFENSGIPQTCLSGNPTPIRSKKLTPSIEAKNLNRRLFVFDGFVIIEILKASEQRTLNNWMARPGNGNKNDD